MKKLLFVVWMLISQLMVVHAQEQIKVQGRVLDAKTKEPIAGASVFIDNSVVGEVTNINGQIQQSALGTVTDAKGNYTLAVKAGLASYSVAYMGYETVRVKVSPAQETIYLTSNESVISEVIVTGYTDIKKRNNTTAYNKVKLDDVRQTGVSGIDQMLEGQVAGLQLSNLNGGPNSAPKIRIRGTVSINGTQDPLWVLDGMPIEGTALPNTFDKETLNTLTNLPIAGLNPDDIADITVLKDAAATAIYGARAANGVIVITTKKGKAGAAKVSISANTFVSQRPDFSKLNLMNGNEKVDFELGLAGRYDLTYRVGNGAIARILNENGELWDYQDYGFDALSAATQDKINALRSGSTDWGKELYRNALNQQYTASISGGSDKHDYYISGGFYDEQATTKDVDMRRYSLTVNNNFKFSEKFKGGLSLLGSTTDRGNFISDADAFTNPSYYARHANPYTAVRNADGSFAYDQDIQGLDGTYIPFNIIEERENTKYGLNNKALKAILNLSYNFIPELALRTELGLQYDETGVERFADKDSYYGRKYRLRSSYYNSAIKDYDYFLPEGGVIENNNTSAFQYNWKSFVEFNKYFNVHEVSVMAGTELRRSDNTIVSTKGFGYDQNTLTTQPVIFPSSTFANEARFRQYQKSIGETAYAAFFANAGYTYDRRYNVFASIRYDGSNMFGVDPKYRFLPIWSVSGAWNVTEEDFMKEQSFINNLKVRASYGTQGNIDRNTYPFVVGKYDNVTILPGGNESAIQIETPPNDKLRWEKTESFNAGIDISVFTNRLDVTVDYYNRKSSDVIGLSNLSLENGFDFLNRNWASVTNQGVELSITSRNIQNSKFSWSTEFNIAHNSNKLTRVQTSPTAYMPDRKEGYPINSLFVLETAGLDDKGLMQFYNEEGEVVSFEDFYQLYDPWADFFPGYMLASEGDEASYRSKFKYKGSLDPKFSGGMTNRFKYANFDFTVSAMFNLNQWRLRTPSYNPARVDAGMNYSKDILNAGTGVLPAIGGTDVLTNDRWMPYSWMADNDPAMSYNYYDIWAKKQSFVRVNSLRLGYTLPQASLAKLKMSNLRFSVEGRNLFVFSNGHEGFLDPETYGDFYAQPISKSIAFGLSASF